jgi:hypothetical protein
MPILVEVKSSQWKVEIEQGAKSIPKGIKTSVNLI